MEYYIAILARLSVIALAVVIALDALTSYRSKRQAERLIGEGFEFHKQWAHVYRYPDGVHSEVDQNDVINLILDELNLKVIKNSGPNISLVSIENKQRKDR